MSKVVIIGGGASGSLAAIAAARKGHQVILLEKNEKIGKKLYITGKGRCNLTNACSPEDFFKNVPRNSKFLFSSIYGFTPDDTIAFFNELGLETKVERGARVFPVSDKSSDVIRALCRGLKENGVDVRLGTEAVRIETDNGHFKSVITADGQKIEGDHCFIATGGLSYPSTGSTGDGLRFAAELGHSVTKTMPSLVAVKIREPWVRDLEGLALKNVVLTARSGNRVKYSDLGEMTFTRDGISGPLVLTLSSVMAEELASGNSIPLTIDLKPGLDHDKLDTRLLKDFSEQKNSRFADSLGKLFPSELIPAVVKCSLIPPDKKVNEITRAEREGLASLIKEFPLTAAGTGGYNEAVITRGGVSVKEINPSTMSSKIVEGISFIGEVIDTDAFTGGFNLQIAWATAYAAAESLEDLK